MAQLFEERMRREYSDDSKLRRNEVDTSLLKTYLIEAHLHRDAPAPEAERLARRIFTPAVLGEKTKVYVARADGDSLLTVNVETPGGLVDLCLDYADRRYWIIHTISGSAASDRVMRRAVRAGPELDKAWIPTEMLERVATLGKFKGLGLDFDRRAIREDEETAENKSISYLKMQLAGDRSQDILSLLRRDDAYGSETAIAKVKLQYWDNSDRPHEFSVDEVKYDGRIAARGTSFDSHHALVMRLYNAYQSRIDRFETVYGLHAVHHESCVHVEGGPITLQFSRPIRQLSDFCDALFSSKEPFRLWGVPVPFGANSFRVRAVDLHVGCRLQFELTPEFIRVYLPKGGCGNTILRLYTNLQHHYDSLVRILNEDGNHVL